MELRIEPVAPRYLEQVLALTPAAGQGGFVEPPADCLREARELSLWRPVALLEGNTVVGFAMYGFFADEGANGRVWLDRLLIGNAYQGRGLGTQAVRQLCARLRAEYGSGEVFLSCYPENTAAIALYEKMGFHMNGETDVHGEAVMVCGAETGDAAAP